METIIVTTDFSAASANALNYACGFANDNNANIVLARIYSVPAGYAAEGLSQVSVNDAIDTDNARLQQELERVTDSYPRLAIDARMVVEDFDEALQQLSKELNPQMIVMGAVTGYAELWQWGDDWLDAVLSLPCPVLVIPGHIEYSPILNIAFACDYKSVYQPDHVAKMRKLVQLTKADFYIVHVTTGKPEDEEEKREALAAAFGEDIDPQFITVENKQVLAGIAAFEQQYAIDLLLVIPRRHGIWHNLFNKSYSRQLAQLNNLPVMAIH